jgi:histidinol-phosphate/aromatic aminotransferase/cobyric acid decarboxylase-like protein
MLIRNDWSIPQPTQSKLNLSNAVCYDRFLVNSVTVDSSTIFSYPNEHRVYNMLAEHFSVPVVNLAIGYGLGELLPRLLSLYRDKKIKIVSPTWQLIDLACRTSGINYSTVEYENFLDLNMDKLYTNDADLIYVANPNGINGQVLTREQIVDLCSYYQLVIVDEAYGDFSDQSVIDIAAALPNLIVAKTFSKSLAIPGVRLGCCVANSMIIRNLQEIRPGYVMSGMTQSILDCVLPQLTSHLDRMIITRNYIENNYSVIKSNSNSILFSDLPDLNCITKEVYPGVHRMALTDLDTFMEIQNERS